MPPFLSIIITNYNYAPFLSAAIDSALAVTWPKTEVIVVDDGSNDGSVEIAQAYGNRLRLITQENRGQTSAANRGFVASNGDLIMFLDSDDTVEPDIMDHIVPVLGDDVVKVQFPMLHIGPRGNLMGSMYPNFPSIMSPELVQQEFERCAFYLTSPTTGNILLRRYCEKIFPLPEGIAPGLDCFFNTAAPLYGKVVTVFEPCVRYRIHENNSWAANRLEPEKFAFYVRDDMNRLAYLKQTMHDMGLSFNPEIINNYSGDLQHRLCYLRFSKATQNVRNDQIPAVAEMAKLIDGDTVPSLLWKIVKSVAQTPGMNVSGKILYLGWFLAVATLPKGKAFELAKMRYMPKSRPKIVSWLMKVTGLRRSVIPKII